MLAERDTAFYTGPGIRLVATVTIPDGLQRGEQRPGIVIAHGFGGIKELILPDFARSFASAGYIALRFDYRGFGGSDGPRFRLIPLEQVEDIRNAVTFLANVVPECDGRVGAYGNSFGGTNVLYAAALDQRIQCVVASVAPGNGERWLRSLKPHWAWNVFKRRVAADRVRRVQTGQSEIVEADEIYTPDPRTHQWHQDVLREFPERAYELPLETAGAIIEYQPEEVVERISPRPALFIGLPDDDVAPYDGIVELYRRAGEPKTLEVLPGLHHHDILQGEPFEQVNRWAIDWYRKYLPIHQSDPAASVISAPRIAELKAPAT